MIVLKTTSRIDLIRNGQAVFERYCYRHTNVFKIKVIYCQELAQIVFRKISKYGVMYCTTPDYLTVTN